MKKIFDIFTHNKEKSERQEAEQERIKITVDYREKSSLVISELTSLGFDIDFQNLKVGDYIINGVCIERKTVSDFISSMLNHRLIRQLEEMQQYESKLLVVEGIDEQELYSDDNPTGMHPNSVRGFLLSILLRHKVPIIFTKNYEDTARFMSVLGKKKTSEAPLNVKKKSLNKKEQLQFILESFPGIGPKTARALLKKFKTVQALILATDDELRETIGKKAESIIFLRSAHYS